MDASYNDIQPWKNKDLLDVFNADPTNSKTFRVQFKQEAEDLFNDKDFSSAPFLQVLKPWVAGNLSMGSKVAS